MAWWAVATSLARWIRTRREKDWTTGEETCGEETCGWNGPNELSPEYDCVHENAQQNTSTAEAGRSVPRTSTDLLPRHCSACSMGIRTKYMVAANELHSRNFLSQMTTWLPPWQDSSLPTAASDKEPQQEYPATTWQQAEFAELLRDGEGSNLSPLTETLMLGLRLLPSFVLTTLLVETPQSTDLPNIF